MFLAARAMWGPHFPTMLLSTARPAPCFNVAVAVLVTLLPRFVVPCLLDSLAVAFEMLFSQGFCLDEVCLVLLCSYGFNWGDGYITDAIMITQFSLSDPRGFFSNDNAASKGYKIALAPHTYGELHGCQAGTCRLHRRTVRSIDCCTAESALYCQV